MSHFLFKPHVCGPKNDITTPDVLIDRAHIVTGGAGTPLPVHRLHPTTELQTVTDSTTVTPAYSLVGCGGGTLLGLAAIVRPTGGAANASDCVLTRSCWRLRNIEAQLDQLVLSADGSPNALSVPLPKLGDLPSVADDSDEGHTVSRGVAAFQIVSGAEIEVSAPATLSLAIVDPQRKRQLSLRLQLTPVAFDPWEQRPTPRYTVGPVGEVKHYI